MWGDNISTVGDNISTVEGIQYCGGIPSVHVGDSFSTVGDTLSTVEVVQYSRGITSVQWLIASVLWRIFSTLGITSVHVGG